MVPCGWFGDRHWDVNIRGFRVGGGGGSGTDIENGNIRGGGVGGLGQRFGDVNIVGKWRVWG